MACGNQRTVGSPASLAGTSLHTGQPVTLTLKPAPADFGIKFRRVDIPDQPFINADVEKVQTVERATSLAEGSVKVHTVEHILSALTGMGIDNAVIEMDANEPPIGDGSSAPYVELIKSAGQGLDLLHPASGIQQHGFMAEMDGAAVPGAFRERLVPGFRQMVGIDDELPDAAVVAAAHGMQHERLMEKGNQRLGQHVGKGTQAGSQPGAEDECAGNAGTCCDVHAT